MSLSHCDLAGFAKIESEWDQLASAAGSPFLTAAWVGSWWRAFAPEEAVALTLSGEDGALRAGALFIESGKTLRPAINNHTNDWGAVAADEDARSRFWSDLAELGHKRVVLEPLLEDDAQISALKQALRSHGYRLVEESREPSPWLELPKSMEALLASRSRNLRSQVGRRTRRLEKEGDLVLRQVTDGPSLAEDLDAFFALEASGWKGEGGTAIAIDPTLVAHYRGFAEAASAQGWLRLYMLELNGKLIAADYGCVFDGCGYLIKTGFDEELGRFAPGLVLRAEVLGASIEEGLDSYDFLGGPDEYKLRWADRMRERSTIHAFRGAATVPTYVWRRRLRPALKRGRDRARNEMKRFGR